MAEWESVIFWTMIVSVVTQNPLWVIPRMQLLHPDMTETLLSVMLMPYSQTSKQII